MTAPDARNLQVVILCGGQGTRIRDVAEDLPKPMIPIGSRPILWHIMKAFSDQGFRRFVLCLGYKSWVIKRYFLDYQLAKSDLAVNLGGHARPRVLCEEESEDWEIVLAETGLDTMTGGRVRAVAKYIDSNPFLLTYGDGVSDVDLHALLRYHRQQGRLGTVTAVRAPGRFGELDLQGPLVTDFTEKPAVTRGRINGGYFVFQREFLKRLPADPGSALEREPLRDLAADGELAAYPHDGFWHSMDNGRDYQYLNQLWAEGKARWATPPEVADRRVA